MKTFFLVSVFCSLSVENVLSSFAAENGNEKLTLLIKSVYICSNFKCLNKNNANIPKKSRKCIKWTKLAKKITYKPRIIQKMQNKLHTVEFCVT